MPYFTKKGTGKNKGKTCVYKKSSKKKVGCTAGPVEKYLTALRMAESEDLEWMMGSPKIRLGELKGEIYDYVSPGDTIYITGRMFLEEFTFDELSDSLYNEGKFIDLYEEPATVLEKNNNFGDDRLNVKFGENITSIPIWVEILNDDWIDLGAFQMDDDLLITLPNKSINESEDFNWTEDFQWTTDMLYSMLENCNEIKVSNYNLTTDSPYLMRGKPVIYTLTRCEEWWDKFSQIPLDDNGRGPAEWYQDYDEGRIGLLATYESIHPSVAKYKNLRLVDFEKDGWTITQYPQEIVNSLNGKHTELFILLDDKGKPIYDLIPKEHRERIKTNWEDRFYGEKLNESEDLDWILDEGKDKTYIIEKLKETFKEYGVYVDWDLEYDRNVNPDGYYEEYFGRFWYGATGGREYFIELFESSEGFFFRLYKLDETDDQYYIDDTYSQQYTLEKEADKFCLLVAFLVLNQCGKLKSTRSFINKTSVNESELGWIEDLEPEFNATMLRYGQKFKNKWGDIIRTIMFIEQDDYEVSYKKPLTLLTFKIVDDPSGYRPYPNFPKDHQLNSELTFNPIEFDRGLRSGQLIPMFKDESFKLKESSDFDWIQKQEPEKVMKKGKSYVIDVRHLKSEPPNSPLSSRYNDLTKVDILDKLRNLGYNVSDIDVDSATYFYVEPQQGTGWEYNEYGVPIDYNYWVDYLDYVTDDPTQNGKYEMIDVDEFMFLIDNNLITESDFDWLDMGEPMSICEAQHKLNVGDTIIVDYLEAWADSPNEDLFDANNATATVLAIDACNRIQPNNTSTDKTILIHVNEEYTGFDEYWVRDFKPKYQKPCMDGRCMYLICGESDEVDEIKVTKLPSKIFGENKKPINEVAGISFEARKWAEIIYNEIISNPEEKTRLIIDGYDHPEAFDGFPIDYVVVDFYDRLTGYGQEHSGYDKDGNYVVLLYVQPKLVSGQGGYSLQSALNHEMKHAWEDYNRLSKGLPSIEQTKESQELYNRDYILMLSDQNVRGPIKEILKYYYYLSNLEKSAYLENVYDQNPAYERVVRDIASKDFGSFKDRFDLDVNWHLMNTAYDIPFLKKFKSPREFIDYSAEELRSRALKMIKKMNKMKYIHGK